jgi:integrase
MHKVEHLIFSSGERYPMLVNDAGLPHFWVTLFMTTHVRPGSSKQNTMSAYISDIRHFMLWEETLKRDVFKEFHNLEFLDESDALLLRDHCLLKTSSVRNWQRHLKLQRVQGIGKGFPSVPRALERVSGNQARNRFVRIVKYLAFTARAILRNRPNAEQINKKIDEMEKTLLANKPKAGKARSSAIAENKAPDLKVFEDFHDAVQFDSPCNPYKNQVAKKRNALAFNILYATGIRAGELLGLKVSDIDYQQKVIKVVRRHDDPEDPRPRQPTAKTNPRDIPVTDELLHSIRDYVLNERAATPGANRHPYLFVTHQNGRYVGRPLSNSGFEKFVVHAVEKVAYVADSYEREALIEEITRHGFRHNFNYMLSLKFDKQNELAETDSSVQALPERTQNQIRMYLNGWSSEDTAEQYNGRHIAEQAREVILADMQEMSKQIRPSRRKK